MLLAETNASIFFSQLHFAKVFFFSLLLLLLNPNACSNALMPLHLVFANKFFKYFVSDLFHYLLQLFWSDWWVSWTILLPGHSLPALWIDTLCRAVGLLLQKTGHQSPQLMNIHHHPHPGPCIGWCRMWLTGYWWKGADPNSTLYW